MGGEHGAERWAPGRRIGSPGLRLPVPGTLEALSTRHAAILDRLKDGVFRPATPLRVFTTAPYRRASDLPVRPFAAFVLRPLDKDAGYAAFLATRAVCVAAMLRHAACEAARCDLDQGDWRTDDWSLRFVAGHGPAGSPKRRTKDDSHPRFSYLPLPTIGHPHADGLIRRVVIAEPFAGGSGDGPPPGAFARWTAQRLAGAVLQDEDRGPVARLEPVEPDEAEFDRVLQLYATRSSREAGETGVSVTPVILPGFDDNKPSKRERLLIDCLRCAGIDPDAVRSIESRRPAWQPLAGGALTSMPMATPRRERRSAWQPLAGGALTSPLQRFRRPPYLDYLPAMHVRLSFKIPVEGPLAIRAGRHGGLGVLAVGS